MTLGIAQLEPLSEVPKDKTRLYSNFSPLWPIRPSLFFMKIVSRIVEIKMSMILSEEEKTRIASKMNKKFPEHEYNTEDIFKHWRQVMYRGMCVTKLLDEDVQYDKSTGLIVSSQEKYNEAVKVLPEIARKKALSWYRINHADTLRYLEMRERIDPASIDGLEYEETIFRYNPDEDNYDSRMEDEEHENTESEDQATAPPSLPLVNIALPMSSTTEEDESKLFDIGQFMEIAKGTLEEKPKRKVRSVVVKTSGKKAPTREHTLIPSMTESQRSKTPCSYCKSQKKYCTRDKPQCSRCIVDDVPCEYAPNVLHSPQLKKRKLITSYQEAIDSDFARSSPDSSTSYVTDMILSGHTLTSQKPMYRARLTREELDQRRHAAKTMLELFDRGHFSESQVLDFAKDLITHVAADDSFLFETAPPILFSKIMSMS